MTEENTAEKTREIEIIGDSLKQIYPIIVMVASELRYKEYFYETRLAAFNSTDNYAGFVVLAVIPTDAIKTPIGVFTLLLLGNNRIMLRVPPRSRWHHDFDITPLEMTKLGLIAGNKDKREFYDELFHKFISSLHDRLTHYGLTITYPKRFWRWIKELLNIYNKVKP